LGQFGEGDALQWGQYRCYRRTRHMRSCFADSKIYHAADEGMHWMLDDATRYFGSLTDTGQQSVQPTFGGLNQQSMLYTDDTIPIDIPTFRSEDNKVDSTMLSYFLSEINQLRPNNNSNNNIASTSGDRQLHDSYSTNGHVRGMGWTSPAPAASGQPVSASATRANSPRGGMFSRAGSNPPEETAEDRWRELHARSSFFVPLRISLMYRRSSNELAAGRKSIYIGCLEEY